MAQSEIEYSIIIPVFNSEKTLKNLISRIEKVFSELKSTFEIVLVDDCSTDQSWSVLKQLHSTNSNVEIFHLIRNFGQHNAILCGFNNCNGKIIITMDDDLQHPPEEIPKLISKIDEGYCVVYGKYPPKNNSLIENFLSSTFQKLIHRILDIPDYIFLSSFAIYRKVTVKNIVCIKSSYPFLPAMAIKSAPLNKISNIEVIHHEREEGTSNYGFIKYSKYSLNLIINYSSWPLILIALFGFIMSIISICFGFWIIIERILDPNYGIMGWNSLMVAISFLGGAILMSMGIIGEYLRRILAETSYGQQYVIGEMEL